MRVISQDGKHDFPYENVIIKLSDDGFVFANFVNGQPFLVAQYSSVEKAENAMRKLHEFYMGVFVLNDAPNTEESIDKLQNLNQSFFSLQPYKKESSIEIVGNSVFRFPEEEEL